MPNAHMGINAILAYIGLQAYIDINAYIGKMPISMNDMPI